MLRAELFGELGAVLRLVEDRNDERPGAVATVRLSDDWIIRLCPPRAQDNYGLPWVFIN